MKAAFKGLDKLRFSFIKYLDIRKTNTCCQQVSVALAHINPERNIFKEQISDQRRN